MADDKDFFISDIYSASFLSVEQQLLLLAEMPQDPFEFFLIPF